MFRFTQSDGQRVPVLWIPSASLSIPVATVSRRNLHKILDGHNSLGGRDDESDRPFLLEDAILLNSD